MECPNSARNSARMNPSQCPNTFPFLKEKKYPFCSQKSFGHYEGDIRALVRALFRALFRHYLRVSRPYKVGRPGSRWRCFQGTGTPHGISRGWAQVRAALRSLFMHRSLAKSLPTRSKPERLRPGLWGCRPGNLKPPDLCTWFEAWLC